MTKEQLAKITAYLKEKVWRNADVMHNQSTDSVDLVDIISSLHNLLCEEVTGSRYNYAFHWANKIGSWTEDNIFDEIMKEGNNERRKEND